MGTTTPPAPNEDNLEDLLNLPQSEAHLEAFITASTRAAKAQIMDPLQEGFKEAKQTSRSTVSRPFDLKALVTAPFPAAKPPPVDKVVTPTGSTVAADEKSSVTKPVSDLPKEEFGSKDKKEALAPTAEAKPVPQKKQAPVPKAPSVTEPSKESPSVTYQVSAKTPPKTPLKRREVTEVRGAQAGIEAKQEKKKRVAQPLAGKKPVAETKKKIARKAPEKHAKKATEKPRKAPYKTVDAETLESRYKERQEKIEDIYKKDEGSVF